MGHAVHDVFADKPLALVEVEKRMDVADAEVERLGFVHARLQAGAQQPQGVAGQRREGVVRPLRTAQADERLRREPPAGGERDGGLVARSELPLGRVGQRRFDDRAHQNMVKS